MSGQQVGTAIGFVVGAYFGYPQLGAAIGGMIGGAIDPTEIEGPHIGDGQQQSSQEGVPIPWVLGTFGWIQGNIVAKSERREVKKEDDGKGSGTVQITYEAHQDYCIMVCESSETRNSTVVGPLIVKINGKIVYDVRPDKSFAAENAKFLQQHTFYVGNEDQMPDATLEAIYGVGNTPAHRGVFTCVARDINLSPYGEAIPTYEWVMVSEGEQETTTTQFLQAYDYPEFKNDDFPLVQPEELYLLSDASRVTTASSETYPGPFFSIDSALNLFPSVMGHGYEYIGYKRDISGAADISAAVPQPSILDSVNVLLAYNEAVPVAWTTGNYSNGATLDEVLDLYPEGALIGDRQGILFRAYVGEPAVPPPSAEWGFQNTAHGLVYYYAIFPVVLMATRIPYAPEAPLGDPCILGVPVQLPDAPDFVIDCAGNVDPAPVYDEAPTSTYLILVEEERETLPPNVEVFVTLPVGPVLHTTDPLNTEAFWEAAADAAGVSGTYGVDYPVAISANVWRATETSTILTNDPITVADAINRICVRGGLSIGQVDTADVDQTLLGYAISNTYDGADSVRSLLTAYGLYGAEYDAQLHFHKLGEDVDIVIDPGEMIAGETHTDQAEREQAIEYPRSILLNYIDIEQDFAVRPQPWRRLTPDVRAIGEETMQVAVVMVPDDAAKTVETYGKRAWARAQGSRKFSVPFAGANEVYLRLHPGKAFGLDAKRWIVDKLLIEDGELAIEATYDRQSAYTSNATAIPALPPTPPPPSLGGVTLFAAMNLPALRDQDDKLLLYFAVAGLLPGWPGCVLQWSADDGASWQTGISSMTEQSVIGYLAAPLADASPYGDDVTNTLSVAVHGGQLDSITYQQFLNEQNPCAIVRPNGTAEILQFLDADELEPNEYDLTTLGRGRLGTTTYLHAQGARFCSLDSVYSLEIPSAFIGRELLFRPVTFGTIPENNASYAITYQPAVSQTELAPEFLTATLASDTLSLSVVPRHRFGTDITPIASVNFVGFRWTITDGSNTATADTGPLVPSAAFDVTGWASPIDVSVSQLNRITGPGPALEDTV